MRTKREWVLIGIRQENRLIERGKQNIERQARIVSDLTAQGHVALALEARRLLATFQALQKRHHEQRNRLQRELTILEGGRLLAAE
jgi:hypothetical protein